MGRPLPKLDKGRSFATVHPVLPDGTAFKQGGYHFDTSGACVEDALTPDQRETHFGSAPDERVLTGSTRFGDDIALSDTVSVKHASVIAQAHRVSGLSVEQWNALGTADREALVDAAIETLSGMLKVTDKTAAPRITKVGTFEEKPESAPAPREPAKFAPAPEAAPKVDLVAFVKGEGKFSTQEVIAAIKAKYGKGFRSAVQAREWLIEEHGYRP